MQRCLVFLSFLLLVAVSVYSQVGAETEGRVVGTVVDEQGQPVNGAQVCTKVVSAGALVGECPALTDRSGQFEMDHVRLGTFHVVASKPEDGYAEFDHNPALQRVTLTLEQPVVTVVLRLGPRGGILVPVVKDAATGEPICEFIVNWHLVTHGSMGISAGAGFSRWTRSTPIPAEKDVVLDSVSARGYKKWVSTDGSNAILLHLERGEHKSVTIELEPDAGQ